MLVVLGGGHGGPIPAFHALKEFGKTVTLVYLDLYSLSIAGERLIWKTNPT